MELTLEGRVAIVSGGSRGIGAAIARSLAREGVSVVICARGKGPLDIVRDEIVLSGGKALAISADCTDPVDVGNVVDRTIDEFHGVDILVNNVGGAGRFADFMELSDSDWLNVFRLNMLSNVYFVRYVLPWLRYSKSPRIINISSISGLQPGFYNPHYASVKAAVINFSKYLANVLASDGILVNTVCPGPVLNDSWDKDVRRMTEETQKIPLGRIGEADDVADLVTFLASERASWITGSCFHVNGGKFRSIH